MIRHPHPMYYYPGNLFEEIFILQNREYERPKTVAKEKTSRVDLREFNKDKWYLSIGDITNILGKTGRVEKGIAAFPEEIPRRLIKLFTSVGETVLDPFLGSGTTTSVAKELGRTSYGHELDLELEPIVLKEVGYPSHPMTDDRIEVVEQEDVQQLRSSLQKKIRGQRSAAKN